MRLSRSRQLVGAVVLFVVSVVLFAVVTVFPTLPEQYSRLPADQQRVVTTAHRNLGYFADKSPTAARLLRFYQGNAVVCSDPGNGKYHRLGQSISKQWFFVYVVLQEARIQAGHKISGSFSAGERILVLRDSSLSPMMQGLSLAHELQHAVDRDLYLNPPAGQLSERWLLGEERANRTVCLMLSEATDGGWTKAVWASQAERESVVVANGRVPATFTIGLAPGDSIRIRSLFGPLTRDDLVSLKLQLSLDANRVNIMKYHHNDPVRREQRAKEMYLAVYASIVLPRRGTPTQFYEIR